MTVLQFKPEFALAIPVTQSSDTVNVILHNLTDLVSEFHPLENLVHSSERQIWEGEDSNSSF